MTPVVGRSVAVASVPLVMRGTIVAEGVVDTLVPQPSGTAVTQLGLPIQTVYINS